jgi:hypothetical protein
LRTKTRGNVPLKKEGARCAHETADKVAAIVSDESVRSLPGSALPAPSWEDEQGAPNREAQDAGKYALLKRKLPTKDCLRYSNRSSVWIGHSLSWETLRPD